MPSAKVPAPKKLCSYHHLLLAKSRHVLVKHCIEKSERTLFADIVVSLAEPGQPTQHQQQQQGRQARVAAHLSEFAGWLRATAVTS